MEGKALPPSASTSLPLVSPALGGERVQGRAEASDEMERAVPRNCRAEGQQGPRCRAQAGKGRCEAGRGSWSCPALPRSALGQPRPESSSISPLCAHGSAAP